MSRGSDSMHDLVWKTLFKSQYYHTLGLRLPYHGAFRSILVLPVSRF